jgi:hypothetical protein
MFCMYRALTVIAAATLAACAQQPAPPIQYAGSAPSLALLDARAIEAAKRHPNAQPRVRPQYPEQAPSPLPAGQSLPPPLYLTRRSAPYVDAQAPINVVVERNVYADNPYRRGYSYGYRRPFGFGLGWDPYGYGYYSPRFRYGYGYSLGAPFWGSRHHYQSHLGGYGHFDRPGRLHLGAPSHQGWHGGSSSHGHGSGHGGFGRHR